MLKLLFKKTIGSCNSNLREYTWKSYHFKAIGIKNPEFRIQQPEQTCRQTCRHFPSLVTCQQHRLIFCSAVHYAKKEVELDEDEVIGKGDKVLKLRLSTTRLDAVLKAGLNISRSKVEKAFYDDRIRVNGQRAKKKSLMLDEGDEVDIVKGTNKLNPLFIDVSRVELVEINLSPSSSSKSSNKNKRDSDDEESDDEDSGNRFPVILKRYKNYTIENYPVPWKGGVADEK